MKTKWGAGGSEGVGVAPRVPDPHERLAVPARLHLHHRVGVPLEQAPERRLLPSAARTPTCSERCRDASRTYSHLSRTPKPHEWHRNTW